MAEESESRTARRCHQREHAVPDYVSQISAGSRTERKQAAFELAKALKRGEAKRYPNLFQQVTELYVRSKNDDPIWNGQRDRRCRVLLSKRRSTGRRILTLSASSRI